MAHEIKMPDLGTAVNEILLLRWLKKEGDTVVRGEPLCEIETDKATTELESIAEGTILKLIVNEGIKIETGGIIAIIGEPGETLSIPKVASTAKNVVTEPDLKSHTHNTVKISPIIRNLAQKMGVDTSTLKGTGPNGQITREDILAAQASAPSQREPMPCAALSKNQLGVTRTITASWKEIVPITLFCKLNMAAAIERRRKSQEQGTKLSFDSIFIKSLAAVMTMFPKLNSYFEKDQIIASDTTNIGIAISVDDDLFVPVIKTADKKSLQEIESALQTFASKAVKRALAPDEMTGATLTVSNLGMFPIEAFTAIVPPKQCGILSIGAIDDIVKFSKTNILVSEKICTVALTVDHRLINGRLGAQILAQLKQTVENI